MNPAFVADPKVQAIAEAYASDAVNLAAKMFNVKLDFEPKSVAMVEVLVAKARAQMAAAKPPDETIWTVAKGFGSYVGEVLRKHHGAWHGCLPRVVTERGSTVVVFRCERLVFGIGGALA